MVADRSSSHVLPKETIIRHKLKQSGTPSVLRKFRIFNHLVLLSFHSYNREKRIFSSNERSNVAEMKRAALKKKWSLVPMSPKLTFAILNRNSIFHLE